MRRNVLQDCANVFCQMFVGWRMVGNDIPTLVRLGRGPLTINVLTGSAEHSGNAVGNLYIAGELRAWFEAQLVKQRILPETIKAATLHVDFDAAAAPRRRHDRLKLRFDCRSSIETADRTYVGTLTDQIEIVNHRPI